MQTVEAFHAALKSGDSSRALAILTPDAVVLESGEVETRDEYVAHHLAADMAFAKATEAVRTPGRVVREGDVAWLWGTSAVRGRFRGRVVDSVGAELMVLRRTAEGWRIAAIHWSSHPRKR